MKKLFGILVLFMAATTVLPQQGDIRIYTNPKPPSRETLDRLDLVLAWHAKVPVDGMRDGIFSLQLIPGKSGTLLVAQTLKGTVVAINPETGDTLWRTPVGLPYRLMKQVGFNDQALFVCRGDMLFALDRDDGTHLLYTIDQDSDQQDNGFGLPFIPSAAVVADRDYLFVCFSDRLVRFVVPDFRLAMKLQAEEAGKGAKRQSSPQPIRQWNFNIFADVLQTPILTRDALILATDEGTIITIDKANPNDDNAAVFARFKTEGAIAAPLASNKSMVYVPSQDYFLYAIDTSRDRLSWRFAGQSPIVDAPVATDADVFVKVSNDGLYRLDRANGNVKWSNKEAVKFLANNRQFVYALDRVGNLLILDYQRGKTMSAWDARDWIISLSNDMTDRIYLASNDGQLVCLRHRDHIRPLEIKTFEKPGPVGKDAEKKDEDKIPKTDDKLPPKTDDKLPPKTDDKLPPKTDDKSPKDKDDKDRKDKDDKGKAGLSELPPPRAFPFATGNRRPVWNAWYPVPPSPNVAHFKPWTLYA